MKWNTVQQKMVAICGPLCDLLQCQWERQAMLKSSKEINILWSAIWVQKVRSNAGKSSDMSPWSSQFIQTMHLVEDY